MRNAAIVLALTTAGVAHTGAAPETDAIVRRWAAANLADWNTAPHFEYTEQVRDDDGAKTYAVMMLLGTPYKQRIGEGDQPLALEKRQQEARKLADERAKRQKESSSERARRIA